MVAKWVVVKAVKKVVRTVAWKVRSMVGPKAVS